jgi:putative ABC transport system permease protein
MNILEFIKLAFFAITRNKMRAFLTMLGIIIGVGSVIAMIGIGEGSKRASVEIIQKMGSNMITIQSQAARGFGPQAAGTAERLRPEDAEAMAAECSNTVVAASPFVFSARPLVWQNNNTMAQVNGTNENYELIRGWFVEEGRFFDEA